MISNICIIEDVCILNISRRVAIFACENNITSRRNQSYFVVETPTVATLKVLISNYFEGKR